MTPKQFIRYTQKLDRKGLAICDGCSAPMHASLFDILYPLFVMSGLLIFITLLLYWRRIKDIIMGR